MLKRGTMRPWSEENKWEPNRKRGVLPLRVISRMRRMRRRIFGKELPSWIRDAMEWFKWINLARLVPTTWVMLVEPAHFFGRLPQILAGKKPYYMSPLHYLSSTVLLQIVSLKVLADLEVRDSQEISLIAVNLLFALASPLLVGIASIASVVIGVVALLLLGGFGPRFGEVVGDILGELQRWWEEGARAPKVSDASGTAPSARLHWARLLWASLYFYFYAYLMLAVLFVIGRALLRWSMELYWYLIHVPILHPMPIRKFVIIPFLALACAYFFVVARTVAFPFAVMIASCIRVDHSHRTVPSR